MNAKISVFVICVEAIIYLLLYSLHDCTFKNLKKTVSQEWWHSTKLCVLVLHLLHLLKPLAHHRNIASLSLFYNYYFGRCSSELPELVSLSRSCGSFTSYSNRLHDFSVTFPPRFCKDFYVNSFFRPTARLWNSLPAECFPLTYDINAFKSRVNRHFLPWVLSIQFSSMTFM